VKRQEDDVEDMDASELIVAVAEPAGLILFLLVLGWAAVERGSVHAYVRLRWRSGLRAARRVRRLEEHAGWHSHR
jgi:hypothetical protein